MQISTRNKKNGFTRTPIVALRLFANRFSRIIIETVQKIVGKQHNFTKRKNMPLLVSGFTLIELMIATALFVIIAVIALSAILSSNVAYKKTDDMRAITDNLTFALEDMSRNIKVGYNYSCDLSISGGGLQDCEYIGSETSEGTPPAPSVGFVPFDVPTPAGVPSDTSTMQGYVVCEEDTLLSNGEAVGSLYKITSNVTDGVGITSCSSVASSDNMIRLTDPRVRLNYQQSGFYVANTALDDNRQPYVTMVLVGETVTKDVVTPFAIQTTVTQRQFGK